LSFFKILSYAQVKAGAIKVTAVPGEPHCPRIYGGGGFVYNCVHEWGARSDPDRWQRLEQFALAAQDESP
jgi:hypothetical protein